MEYLNWNNILIMIYIREGWKFQNEYIGGGVADIYNLPCLILPFISNFIRGNIIIT